MVWQAAVAQAGMDLAGGYLNHVRATNAATDQRHFAREMFKKQVQLANTAHQRQVKDLRAAGLNPILSAKGSGATTPAAMGYQQPHFQPIDTGGAVRAYSAAHTAKLQQAQANQAEASEQQILQNINNLKATEEWTRAQTQNVSAELENIKQRAHLMAAQRAREEASAKHLNEQAREKFYQNEYNKIIADHFRENPTAAIADRHGVSAVSMGSVVKSVFGKAVDYGKEKIKSRIKPVTDIYGKIKKRTPGGRRGR